MSHYNQPPRYHAYLLRFWQERGRDLARTIAWRFSLEDPHTGERQGFANFDELREFLAQRMRRDDAPHVERGVETEENQGGDVSSTSHSMK